MNNILALLGMNFLQSKILTPCTVTRRLIGRVTTELENDDSNCTIYMDLWSSELPKAFGVHLYARIYLTTPIYMEKAKLVELHRTLYHTGTQRLSKLIQNALLEDSKPETSIKRMRSMKEDSRCTEGIPRNYGNRKYSI